ncbi:efflux RND transporter periplasmic adaptor subunit [Bradyrhizobium sp. LHD-71]|uniref:efflux RND transporter periplasmic adaptor subunit n=1 Tax=Bradyrhizobium sp. LHD-71 TaxID=3072141 RepID=UPI00280CDDED|nr:efflux RND transporter periplasmic adaptor subunit [Bradyrhizobium sp. LHD-71]MDQ8728542.1 efflux RND transporter periplasmic adaptor subunit [Bradyrhizobium sp. LHD-71]
MTIKAKLLLAALALIGAAGYLVHARASRATPVASTEQPVPVSLLTAMRSNFPVLLKGLGTVQPFNTVTVRSRVDGEIVKIAFREGQTVQQGDLLAQIDARPYQATLDQAVAKKAQDEATLTNAKLDLQRYSTLAKQEFASRQQLDTQVAAVAQDTALAQADQAAIDNAQTQLSYTTIKAPITGRVGFRLVDQGNIVNASNQSGLATIAQVRPISVVFTLPEREIDRINKAMAHGCVPVAAFTTDGTRKLAEGTLTVVNNQVDTTTGVIQLKATFANEDDALWPGQSLSVQVLVGTLDNVVVLPQSAIERGQQGLWTYVVDKNQRAEARPIQIGEADSRNAVVVGGIAPGDRIVTAGQYGLQDGALVTPRPDPGVRQ